MILKTRAQQEAFLRECESHIQRIVKDIPEFKQLNNIFINHPRSIHIITNNKVYWLEEAKVLLLQKIYNKVLKLCSENQTSIDLDKIFAKVNAETEPRLSELNRRDLFTSSTYVNPQLLMQTHRATILRTGWLRFLGRFFKPKSEQFLKKYGFFDLIACPPIVSAVFNIDKLKTLISPQTIHQRDNYGLGRTALEVAARHGKIPAMQLLLRHGAKATEAELLAAIRGCHPEAVNLLLSHGADLNAMNSHKNMCVYEAISSDDWYGDTMKKLAMLSELIRKPIQWEKQQNGQSHGWPSTIRYLKQNYENQSHLSEHERAQVQKVFSELFQTLGQYILLNPKTFSLIIKCLLDFIYFIEGNPGAIENFYELLLRNPKLIELCYGPVDGVYEATFKNRAPPKFQTVFQSDSLKTIQTAAKTWLSQRDVKRVARLLWIGKRRGAVGFAGLNHDMIAKISAYTRDSDVQTVQEAEQTARLALRT